MDTFWDTHTISLLGGAELRGNKSKRFYTKRYGYDPDTGNFSTPVNPDPGSRLRKTRMLLFMPLWITRF